MATSRMNEITSPECKRYLERGGDLAVIPVGCVERLGPHLPLGARGMVADAIALRLAEKCEGLCLPLIPYSTLYDTSTLPGSLDIAPKLVHDYLTDVCDELRANQFARIILVGFQEELYYLCQEYFQKNNMAVAWLHPDRFYTFSGLVQKLDRHGRELWRFAGCLEAAGNRGMLNRVWQKSQEFHGKYQPVKNSGRDNLALLGNTGHPMLPEEWTIYPTMLGESLADLRNTQYEPPSEALLQKARCELEDWLDTLRDPVEALREYQGFLDGHVMIRPQ